MADHPARQGLLSRVSDRLRDRGRDTGTSAATTVEAGPAGQDADAAPQPPADEGWVHHDGTDATGFEGWLYHYADGTIADADGTVYVAADAATPAATPAAADEASATPTEHGPAHVAEAAPETTAAPADAGTADAAPERSGPPTAAAPEVAPDPEPEPEPEPAAVHPEPTSEPEPDPAPEPKDAEPKDAEGEPAPADPAPVPDDRGDTPTDPDDAATDVPGFVEYTSSDLPRYVFGAVFLLAAVTGVLTLLGAVQGDGSWPKALVLLFVAAAAAWALGHWAPKVVTLEDGHLEVTRAGNGDRFDLRDPRTTVEVGSQTRSPTWQARFEEPEGSRVTLRRHQVKVAQFVAIVEHHRAHLREDSHAAQVE